MQYSLSGIDAINLRGIDAHGGMAGDQSFGFAGSNAPAHAVWVTAASADRTLNGDVTGNARADFQIRLTGLASLIAADLLT